VKKGYGVQPRFLTVGMGGVAKDFLEPENEGKRNWGIGGRMKMMGRGGNGFLHPGWGGGAVRDKGVCVGQEGMKEV